jgi:Concanavalin A-like lectin/glucanases superfamily
LIGTQGTWKTSDGFTTVTSGPNTQHADPQEYHFNGPNDMWVASDGGVDLYVPDLSTCASKSFGLTGTEFWGFDQGWNEDTRVGSYYHNGVSGYRPAYPNNQWRSFAGGEPATGYLSVKNPAKAWFSYPGGVYLPETLMGSYSTFSYGKFPNEAYWARESRSEVVTHPLYSDTHLLGKDNVLWQSTDGGLSFTPLYTFGAVATHLVTSIEISRANPLLILVYQYKSGAVGALWKSTDGGVTFNEIAQPASIGNGRGCFITMDPQNADQFWIAYNTTGTSTNKVYKTTNGGTSWTNITGLLSNSTYGGVRAILHIGGTDGGVYAMTRHSMFYRNNTHTDWQPFGFGLPVKLDNNYLRPFYKENKLRMATIDRGLWGVDLYENPSTPLAQPIVDKKTSACHRDTFYFEDYSMLNHTGASWAWTFTPAPTWVSSTSARNPKVVFGAGGSYTVSLTVTNGSGVTSTKSVTNMVFLPSANSCSTTGGAEFTGQIGGGSDYFQTTQALPLGTANTITIAGWIKPTGIQAANAGLAFTNAGAGGTGFNFRSNNQLGYHWNESGGSYNWSGGPTVSADVWSHVALVIESTKATVYLNGVAYTRTAAHPAISFPNAWWIGNDRADTARTMLGQIDEMRFYNRALTQSEIRDLRHLTYPSYAANDPALVTYYKFNETSGIVYDRVGLVHAAGNGTAANRVVRAAPFEKGVSQRVNITASGTTSYAQAGVRVEFAAGATLPNGEVALSRLDSTPIAPISPQPLVGNRYWVLNNYGTNAAFTSPSSLVFSNIPVGSNIPQRYKLYRRASNDFTAAAWTLVDVADAVTVGAAGTITFNTGINLTGSSQLAIFDFANELPSVALTNTFIQGYMNGMSMRPVLFLSNVPGSNLLQCDTLTVELHQGTSPYALLQSFKGVLMIDGTMTAYFSPAANNTTCYVVVRGRNIIETWSSVPVLIQPGATYSFATAYGNNLGTYRNVIITPPKEKTANDE